MLPTVDELFAGAVEEVPADEVEGDIVVGDAAAEAFCMIVTRLICVTVMFCVTVR